MYIKRYLDEERSVLSLREDERRELEARYERDFPHAVRVDFRMLYGRMREEGETRTHVRMARWAAERGAAMDYAESSRRGLLLMCFANPADADAFVADWGGARVA